MQFVKKLRKLLENWECATVLKVGRGMCLQEAKAARNDFRMIFFLGTYSYRFDLYMYM